MCTPCNGKAAPHSPHPIPYSPLLLVGPGAELLYEKFNKMPETSHLFEITVPQKQHCGNALTLLEIARKTRIIEAGLVDYFSGPEYIRKSDAELNFI